MEQIIVDKLGGINMSNDKLSGLVKEYLEVDANLQSDRIALEEIRNQIKDELAERGVEEIEVDSYLIKSRSQLVSTFNTKKFKEHFPELYGLFLTQVSRSQFSIS